MSFLCYENNCFQIHESHQLSTPIRIKSHLLLYKFIANETCNYPGSHTTKRESKKRQLQTIVKNSIKFFEKGVSKPLKPKSMPFKTFICANVPYSERQ